MNILNHLVELFFPRTCVCCSSRLIHNEKYICLYCLISLPKTDHLSKKENQLEQFFAGRFPFVRIASFSYFVKGGSIQKLVHELKYKNNPTIGTYIGELCGNEIVLQQAFSDIDYLLPIPLHPKRLAKRGYNQALMIAKGIAIHTQIPIMKDNLIRVIDNPSQTKNTRFARWTNSEGIFDLKNKNMLINKHVLLIDDIITTGSTIETCAKLLLNVTNNNIRISIYCIGSAI